MEKYDIISEVEKMTNCGSLEKGYIEFKCNKCGSTKKVGFRCRCRFCTSCGKVYVDNWVESIMARLLNTKHRHMNLLSLGSASKTLLLIYL